MSGGRLHPTLPHRMGEAPTSLASRLAQLHISENASARFFCADMGIDFGGLVQGQPDSVMAFAELAGADPDQLAAEAFRRVPGGHVFRGEVFPKSSLSRTSLRFCPACLLDDCSGAARPETAASGRTIWSVSSIRTCPDHGVGIVEVDQTVRPSQTHDFAQILKPLLPELGKLADQSPRRAPSALERYALDRLAGTVGSAPWLDGLPLHAVLAFCEIIGMVDCFGREVRATKLSESEWFEAGGSGFSIASRGEIGVREFMDDLIRTYPYSGSATEGPQAVLGRLFKFLSFGSPHSDFDIFRDLVADFMIERMPFGPGDIIFGKPIERRVLHSVHSAAQELQVHPKRLRKVLHAAGVLTTEQLDLANGNAVFDAIAAGPTLSDAVDGLFMTEIEPYLGTGRVQTKLLVDAGIVEPMFPKRPDLDHLFRRRDLDAFLERLFVGAVPIDAPDDDMVDVQKAVKRVCCSTVDVVRLVLDRKLGFVGRQTDKHGFSALLVSVTEVRSLMRGSMEGWLTAETIETTMRTSWAVVRNLIDRGILPVETIVSPLNRCPVRVIPQAAFDEFRREYTTLFEAMETTGIHFLKIQKRLTALGIEPGIRREDVGAAFYRRSDLLRL